MTTSYEEVPVEILDRQVNPLRNKEAAMMKVLWRNHLVEGSIWEAEDDMISLYPHLFQLLRLDSTLLSLSFLVSSILC